MGANVRFRYWFFAQKYRFDLGNQFMAIINFGLLVLTFRKTYGLSLWLVPLAFPLVIGLIWAFGAFLDRFGRSQEKNEEIVIERSPLAKTHYAEQKRIIELLEEIKGKL